jgi:DNA-binding NarL/FixJ family response regulator
MAGATNRALAQRLHVSPATIRHDTHNIFEKSLASSIGWPPSRMPSASP